MLHNRYRTSSLCVHPKKSKSGRKFEVFGVPSSDRSAQHLSRLLECFQSLILDVKWVAKNVDSLCGGFEVHSLRLYSKSATAIVRDVFQGLQIMKTATIAVSVVVVTIIILIVFAYIYFAKVNGECKFQFLNCG